MHFSPEAESLLSYTTNLVRSPGLDLGLDWRSYVLPSAIFLTVSELPLNFISVLKIFLHNIQTENDKRSYFCFP